ncbi:MAG: hypothetical protein SPJ83_06065 [Helicobacter sp.]|uniref:Fimbrial assembly protein (PilN) n=1 Tax=Helicobacter bilis ATCC 43879 TaxID=613026 RepID=C3XDJ2_9HELI|nr:MULTISPECIES: hypothetical protein [Helicobacter]EEO23081.1 hypothetical protein HRAG_00138 [Helicobacter bilis ATCC 43879]MDY5822349.1 hypothetical protein [Helicobacter sp.]MDY5951321.1 hypothetical protein [Helicobacter sp.]
MTYSFTKATTKHVLKPATKIWGFYFILAFGILIVFKVQLLLQVENLKETQNLAKAEQERIIQSTKNLEQESERLYYELEVAQKINVRDEKLRMQIQNIIAMIPQGVQISTIRFENNQLFMRGTTISRELFETSLQSQLRTIYARSNASFYELPSGWLNFESISQTLSDDGLIERIDNI